MGSLSPLATGAGTVDKLLGSAFQIVKHVQEHLDEITLLAAISEELTLLAANIETASGALLANNVAIIMAGMANYRATYAEAIADFGVGEYFTSAESGALRLYKRTVDAPYYADQGDVVAPVSKTLLATTGGAGLIGTSEADINVEEALAARPKSTLLAGVTGASLIGTAEEGTVEEALGLRPTADDLSDPTAAGTIGADHLGGATIAAVLAALTPFAATTAQLSNVVHVSNTTGKFFGKQAFVSDDNKLYVAQGASNISIWRSADGESTITPV